MTTARALSPDVDRLLMAALNDECARLQAELAQASAALEDPDYLARRLARLLADKPDLRELARYIASNLENAMA